MANDNFYTSTEILNKVYSGTSLTGFSSDTEILNAVFDSSKGALRISGGGSSGATYDDSSISTALSSEISDRTVADSSLSTAINVLSTSVSGITEEISIDFVDFIGEGKVLGVVSGVLSGVTVVADTSSLSTSLSTETSTREVADQSLSTSINTISSSLSGVTEVAIESILNDGQILYMSGTALTGMDFTPAQLSGILSSIASLSTAINV